MINAEAFLSNLQNFAPTVPPTAPFTCSGFSELPPSIVRVCELGWRVAPVLAHSISASIKGSMITAPTNDVSLLASSARERCNWAVATGRGFLILEVDLERAQHSLRSLCSDEWGWRKTLSFRCRTSRFFAFSHSDRQVRFLGSRFPGLRLHWEGSFVLVPPSWFVYGPPLSFDDLNASVSPSPRWLSTKGDNGGGGARSGGRYER
jgi:hypothetical protein